jgi:hypothetical protein
MPKVKKDGDYEKARKVRKNRSYAIGAEKTLVEEDKERGRKRIIGKR